MSLNLLFRTITVFVFIATRVYWYKAKLKSNSDRNSVQNKTLTIEKIGIIISAFIVGVSLLGLTVFTFENVIVQFLGLIFVVLGNVEAILGRATLGSNWTESYKYQVKKKHKLIITGLYRYVRHPIYGGFMVAITGAFIVSETYLFIPLFFLQLIIMTKFAKREEKLLSKYFGEKYLVYAQKTKMFVPFVF